ncbi:MAG: hypothetical protein AAGA34_02285 [Pseudomonadota bacterium]
MLFNHGENATDQPKEVKANPKELREMERLITMQRAGVQPPLSVL